MVQVLFYPLDITTRTVAGKPVIAMYGRTVSGERIAVLDQTYVPYFYAQLNSGAEISSLTIKSGDRQYSIVKTEHVVKKVREKDTPLAKIYTNHAFGMSLLADELMKQNIAKHVFEHDVPFVQSYCADRKMLPGFLVVADGEFTNSYASIPVFDAHHVFQEDEQMQLHPNILAFDIETFSPHGAPSSPEQNPIIMVSFHGEHFTKTITWKRFITERKDIEFVDGEYELLMRFKRIIEEQKPDILAGYTSDLFAFPYIQKRADKYNIPLDIGADRSIADVGRGETYIKGISHLDLYSLVSNLMKRKLESDTYRLKDVALELLGEGKKQIDIDRLSEVWEKHPEQLEPFCDYNAHDASLIYRIGIKSLPLLYEFVKLTGMLPHAVSRGSISQFMEAFLIRESRFAGEIIPEKGKVNEQRKTFGIKSFVDTEQGMYSQILAYDFTLLRPSIIVAHNISNGTLRCSCCTETVPGENMHFCKNVKGFFPKVTGTVLDRRKRIHTMLNDTVEKSPEQMAILSSRYDALTELAAVLHGALSFSLSRWYSEDCSIALHAYGNHYISLLLDKAKESGFMPVYADAESVFLKQGSKSAKAVRSFLDSVVLSLPEKIEVSFSSYPKALFVPSRIEKKVKGKYAVLSSEGFIKMHGFDSSRRNLSTIAKETQEKVLYYLLKEQNPGAALLHVRHVIDDVNQKNVPLRKTIIYTQLQKDVGKYEVDAPHVAVAKRMQQRGFTVAPGLIIRYIVVKGTGSIAERSYLPNEAEHYDSEYYVNNQILPAVDTIFEAAGIDIKEALQEKEQSNLREFL